MSEQKKSDVEPTQKKPTENAQPKPPGWKILHRIGRTERPIGGEGSEQSKRTEFENLKGRGMPGTVILVDDKGQIVQQILGFAEDKVRRYKDESGKPYEPTMVNMGARKPVDLRPFRDIIASMPETDPDLDSSDDSSGQSELSETTQSAVKGMAESIKVAPRQVVKVDESKQLGWTDDVKNHVKSGSDTSEQFFRLKNGKLVPREDVEKILEQLQANERKRTVEATRKSPTPRSKRVAAAPCQGGLVGLLGAVNAARTRFAEIRHVEQRAKSRRRRFLVEILIRAAVGAPVCRTTVEAAFADASDATRL